MIDLNDVMIVLQDGSTALHLAVECCKPQVVQTLLGYGAQVELKGGQVHSLVLWYTQQQIKDNIIICVFAITLLMILKCGSEGRDNNNFLSQSKHTIITK